MGTLLAIAAVVVGGLFSLWTVLVTVYLVGAHMKPIVDAHEGSRDRGAIWGWGVLYTINGLILLFLLVRFVKFAWTL